MIDYNAVYEIWLEQCRIKHAYAMERTAKAFDLSETDVRHIVNVISRRRARLILKKARMNNMFWRNRRDGGK